MWTRSKPSLLECSGSEPRIVRVRGFVCQGLRSPTARPRRTACRRRGFLLSARRPARRPLPKTRKPGGGNTGLRTCVGSSTMSKKLSLLQEEGCVASAFLRKEILALLRENAARLPPTRTLPVLRDFPSERASFPSLAAARPRPVPSVSRMPITPSRLDHCPIPFATCGLPFSRLAKAKEKSIAHTLSNK